MPFQDVWLRAASDHRRPPLSDQHLTYLLRLLFWSLDPTCVQLFTKQNRWKWKDSSTLIQILNHWNLFCRTAVHCFPSLWAVYKESVGFPASKCVLNTLNAKRKNAGLWYGCRCLVPCKQVGALQASGLSWRQEARNSVWATSLHSQNALHCNFLGQCRTLQWWW